MWSQYKTIFIYIPYNGSEIITSLLNQDCGLHRASVLRSRAGNTTWSHKLVFTVVRDPYERYAAALREFGTHYKIPKEARIPQSWYLDTSVNYIIRYENLTAEWDKIAEFIGLHESIPLPSIKTKSPLTDRQERFVRETYELDFKRFGYSVKR